MITKVLSKDGHVVHDCEATGCEVSWDGYKISTGRAVKRRSKTLPDGKKDGKTFTFDKTFAELHVEQEQPPPSPGGQG